MHTSKPFFTAQFHPEAMGGPTDTSHLFDMFLENCKKQTGELLFEPRLTTPVVKPKVSKVLVLGRCAGRVRGAGP